MFGIKCAMVGAELVVISALLAILGCAGLPRARVLIYAWHPLPIWEFAGNAMSHPSNAATLQILSGRTGRIT